MNLALLIKCYWGMNMNPVVGEGQQRDGERRRMGWRIFLQFFLWVVFTMSKTWQVSVKAARPLRWNGGQLCSEAQYFLWLDASGKKNVSFMIVCNSIECRWQNKTLIFQGERREYFWNERQTIYLFLSLHLLWPGTLCDYTLLYRSKAILFNAVQHMSLFK